jgi:hypothetical protein
LLSSLEKKTLKNFEVDIEDHFVFFRHASSVPGPHWLRWAAPDVELLQHAVQLTAATTAAATSTTAPS